MAIKDWIRHVLARFKRVVIYASAVGVIIWFVFFDSYNLVLRIQMHREKAALTKHNEAMRVEIDHLENKLSGRLSDKEVERIARENFNMSRNDEVVYPIVSK